MSLLNLYCIGGTSLSYHNPDADLSEESEHITSAFFVASRVADEEQKVYAGNRYYDEDYTDFGAAYLKFEGNAILKYKNIRSVHLIFKANRAFYDKNYDGNGKQYLRYGDNQFVACIAPYSNEDLHSFNLSSYKTKTPANFMSYDFTTQIGINAQSATLAAEVTDVYKSRFAGENSQFIIAAGLVDGVGSNYIITSESSGHFHNENVNTHELLADYTRTIDPANTYLLVEYDDASVLAPTPLYPCKTNIKEADSMTFRWQYNSTTMAQQESATIQYKNKTSVGWTTVTSNGSQTNYLLNVHLPQGTYEWRVKTTNEINEESDYSDTQEFNVIGKPASPIINTPVNKCLTTITWNASDQEAVEILIYKDNELIIHNTIATSESLYKPQMFLKGTYRVKLRIKNKSDYWSDYTETEIQIDAAGPQKGELSTIVSNNKVILKGNTNALNAAIIRKENGKEDILSLTNEYTDDTLASGVEYKYYVRAWDGGGYTDSEPKSITINFDGSIIKTNNFELNLRTSEDKFLAHDESISRDLSVNNFVGREYPVIERGEFTTRTISKRFHVTREQKLILDEMSKEPAVFYRDSRRNAFKAVITYLQYTEYMNEDYIAEITFLKTAPDEVIINV